MAFIHDITPEFPALTFLDANGGLAASTPEAQRSPELWVQFREHISLTRRFDQRAINLQRTGRLGTYASCYGQEAISTAVGLVMRAEDVLVPYYRDQAAQLLRGVRMQDILRFWGGDERGSDFPFPCHDMPNCVPIATQIPHAAGIASAIRLRGEKRVVLATCGDGATSRGDFYEALNLAGVWHLPLVIVVNNNQWAISVPVSAQTACQTLAQKAVAAGIPGVRVDGNDVLALHAVIGEALARARAGKGPVLVEAVTYRLCDHTTADDMSRYADPLQRQQAETVEPMRRLQLLLQTVGRCSDEEEIQREQRQAGIIDSAIAGFLADPAPLPTDMFDFLFASLPDELLAQRQAALIRGRRP